MDFYGSLIRPLAFRFDAERVHERAMAAIERGLVKCRDFHDDRLAVEAFGVKFAHPLGLAAGFDKNAVAVNHWHKLGFSHVELGTVTFHAQPGNPKPRLFRLPEDKAIINRMGFNNDGAAAVAARLAAASPQIPIGINLGKSKITELAEAPADYRETYRLLQGFGQYFVVNVSSPNTPGLRSLQEKGPLLDILRAMDEIDTSKPRFIKVAPDLELSALDEVLEVAVESKATGIIATNTTISRPDNLYGQHRQEAGGLSGMPVRDLSDRVLSHIAKQAPAEMVLIGVGGIFDAEDVWRKITLGAHLTQVYTGWIYGGPHMVPNVMERLVAKMEREGVKNLADLRRSGLK